MSEPDSMLPPLARRASAEESVPPHVASPGGSTPGGLPPPLLAGNAVWPLPVSALPAGRIPEDAAPWRTTMAAPGVLGAIGVMSIVVAGLSILASLGAGFMTFGLMIESAAPAVSSAAVAASAPAPTSAPSAVSPATLPAAAAPTGAPDGSDASPGFALTPSEVTGAAQHAQRAAGGALTPAQLASLTTLLQDPHQQVVAPGTAWSPVRLAMMQPDGSATVVFTGSYIILDSNGVVQQQTNVGRPRMRISSTVLGLNALENLLSVLLAVLLLIAGICTLRRARAARRLHLIFAGLKLVVAIGGGIAFGAMWRQIANGGAGAASSQGVGTIFGAIFIVLGVLYPIALLIALNTPRVRDHYRQLR